jgi:hypothetical protein
MMLNVLTLLLLLPTVLLLQHGQHTVDAAPLPAAARLPSELTVVFSVAYSLDLRTYFVSSLVNAPADALQFTVVAAAASAAAAAAVEPPTSDEVSLYPRDDAHRLAGVFMRDARVDVVIEVRDAVDDATVPPLTYAVRIVASTGFEPPDNSGPLFPPCVAVTGVESSSPLRFRMSSSSWPLFYYSEEFSALKLRAVVSTSGVDDGGDGGGGVRVYQPLSAAAFAAESDAAAATWRWALIRDDDGVVVGDERRFASSAVVALQTVTGVTRAQLVLPSYSPAQVEITAVCGANSAPVVGANVIPDITVAIGQVYVPLHLYFGDAVGGATAMLRGGPFMLHLCAYTSLTCITLCNVILQNGDALRFTIAGLDAAPSLRFVPADNPYALFGVAGDDDVGSHLLSITAVDGRGGARTATLYLHVLAAGNLHAPTHTSIDDFVAVVGDRVDVDVTSTFADADADAVGGGGGGGALSLLSLSVAVPVTTALQPLAFSLVPPAAPTSLRTSIVDASAVGVHRVVVTADDGGGGVTSVSFTVSILTPALPPAAGPLVNTSGAFNGAESAAAAAGDDGDDDTSTIVVAVIVVALVLCACALAFHYRHTIIRRFQVWLADRKATKRCAARKNGGGVRQSDVEEAAVVAAAKASAAALKQDDAPFEEKKVARVDVADNDAGIDDNDDDDDDDDGAKTMASSLPPSLHERRFDDADVVFESVVSSTQSTPAKLSSHSTQAAETPAVSGSGGTQTTSPSKKAIVMQTPPRVPRRPRRADNRFPASPTPETPPPLPPMTILPAQPPAVPPLPRRLQLATSSPAKSSPAPRRPAPSMHDAAAVGRIASSQPRRYAFESDVDTDVDMYVQRSEGNRKEETRAVKPAMAASRPTRVAPRLK